MYKIIAKNKKITLGLLLALLLLFTGLCWAAPVAATMQIKGSIRYIEDGSGYGILTEDGKKYEPMRILPKEFRRPGLEVVAEVVLRPDLVGTRMWGTIVEVRSIADAAIVITPEDRLAIPLLVRRMAAFNGRDLPALKQMDLMAQSLTEEQFRTWVAGYSNFTLEYVDTLRQSDTVISGFCLYSRERMDGVALSGNTQHSLMSFKLIKREAGWVFQETGSYKPDTELEPEAFLLVLQKKTKKKFGVEDMAKWRG